MGGKVQGRNEVICWKNLTSTTKVVLEAQWEYVQRHVCFVNIQSSLHENVVFSVRARMGNTPYIIFIMWNSISGLDALYHLLVVVWLSW